MNLLTRFRSWLKWIANRQKLESEMETEVRFHLSGATLRDLVCARAFPSKKRSATGAD